MSYESSYDSGRMPFKPDLTRGYWSSPIDYAMSGLSLAFRLDIFSSAWFVFAYLGAAAIVPYLICMVLFVVPFMIVQSFLGQFSSTGFISTFRVSPLFKGIGFIALGVNLTVLSYYSIFAAVPFLYLFHSFRPTLPWSCEGIKDWNFNFTANQIHHLCKLPSYNGSTNNTTSWSSIAVIQYEVPSILFFTSRFNESNFLFHPESRDNDYVFSWELILGTLLTWSIIAAVFYKFKQIEKLGGFLRYTIGITLVLLLIILMRFSVLPQNASTIFFDFFAPKLEDIGQGIPVVALYLVSAFGAGWGTVIALASFNHFRTDLVKQNWLICLGQMCVFLAFAFITHLVHNVFNETKANLNKRDDNMYHYVNQNWLLYLSTGSVIADMELPNMWCFIFFTMLILAALVTMIITLVSTVQSLCDEFETLRSLKHIFPFALIATLALCSLYTCTNHGVSYFSVLSTNSLITQNALNLLLLFVVLWVYGRLRFQRDIQFMLNRQFNTFKVYILRFVAPLCFLILLFVSCIVSVSYYHSAPFVMHIIADIFIVFPWIFVPGYIILTLLQTAGPVKIRLKRCCHPLDWYPVESEERQRYEEILRNTDLTHQLNEFVNEIVL